MLDFESRCLVCDRPFFSTLPSQLLRAMKFDYDLLIIGGGLVGASLACALGRSGLRIGVVEPVPFKAEQQPSYDDRAIALAQGTQRIFSGMDLWERLAEEVTPILQIHVSDRGRFGFTRLRHEEAGVAALGYTATARLLGHVLVGRLSELDRVEVLCPARLEDVSPGDDAIHAEINVNGECRSLSARLLVAADGADSAVRERFGIPVTLWDYGQSAIVANVTSQLDHENVAYERFTEKGPIALLPMGARRCAIVWSVRNERLASVEMLDDAEFLAALQANFGYRLGRFQAIGKRASYALRLVKARDAVRPRLALIGNAAHALHPIAGQGFNLGLRDVAALAECLTEVARARGDPGNPQLLQRYAQWRRYDQGRVIAFTDGLTRLFANPLLPVALLRDAGMLALDFLPPAKRLFGKLTMGRIGRLPRLARGLPL
jgi:2-octaprenyl-6-methoxyphenol hydroxylase